MDIIVSVALVEPSFLNCFLVDSLISTMYSMISEPPSLSDDCHWIVKEVSVIPDISSGPRGAEGLSVKNKRWNHSRETEFLKQ